MLESIRIVPFELADLDALMEIEDQSFAVPWSRASYEELWPLPNISIWVAKEAGALVGYYLLQCVGDEAELHTYAVKPESRRRGIGEHLLRHMVEELKRRRVRRVFLQVRPSNAPARALYDKMGFAPVGIRRRYYRDNDEDAFVLRLEIAL